jgi:hypothetical protein
MKGTGYREQVTERQDQDTVTCSLSPGPYHCATCSDEARPAKVLSVDAATGLAFVTIGDTSGEVDISLVDQVEPGQVLLIHGGVAIGKI